MDSVASIDSDVSIQRKKYDEITNNLAKQLNLNQKPIGICELCGKDILEEADATCALNQLYHHNCFTCDTCGRTLRGKKFYKVNCLFDSNIFHLSHLTVKENGDF